MLINCVIVEKYRNVQKYHKHILFVDKKRRQMFKVLTFKMETVYYICESSGKPFFWKQEMMEPTFSAFFYLIRSNSSYDKQRFFSAICVNKQIKVSRPGRSKPGNQALSHCCVAVIKSAPGLPWWRSG